MSIDREPKKVSEEEYRDFYKTLTSSEEAETLGWAHWKVSAPIPTSQLLSVLIRFVSISRVIPVAASRSEP